MKSLILYLFLAASANATLWQRHVLSGQGESFDTPQPQPLSYFIQDPFLRDDGNQFCSDCTPRGKAAVHLGHKFQTELKKIGTLQGFAVYDLLYSFDDHVDTGEIDWKSILVEVAPEQFREIYHLQPTAAKIEPAFLLKIEGQDVLATRDVIPGTGIFFYEDYFWFSTAGAARIDIEMITAAVKSILPSGAGVWKGYGLDMANLRYHMPVWKDGDSNCCPTGGTVDIKFRLAGAQIIVTSKHFDPNAPRG